MTRILGTGPLGFWLAVAAAMSSSSSSSALTMPWSSSSSHRPSRRAAGDGRRIIRSGGAPLAVFPPSRRQGRRTTAWSTTPANGRPRSSFVATTTTTTSLSGAYLDDVDQEELMDYMNSDLSISFKEYHRSNAVRGYLSKCPLFNDCSSAGLDKLVSATERIKVPEGTKVIEQGSSGDDCMYFLRKGTLDCVLEEVIPGANGSNGTDTSAADTVDDASTTPSSAQSPRLLTTYSNEGDYFGELALLFGQPRAATIIATSDCVLYRLNKTAFSSSVVDSPVYWDAARNMMLRKYAASRLRDALSSMSFGECADLVRARTVQALGPWAAAIDAKTLRTFAIGAAVSVMSGMAAPGSIAGRMPQLLDLDRSVPALSRRLASLSLTAAAIFSARGGNEGDETSDSSGSVAMAWLTASFWLASESSLCGGGGGVCGFLGDAWSPYVGRPVLLLALAGSLFQSFRAVSEAPTAVETKKEEKDDEVEVEGGEVVKDRRPSVRSSLLSASSSLLLFAPATLALLTTILPAFGARSLFEAPGGAFLASAHSSFLANFCLCWQLTLVLCQQRRRQTEWPTTTRVLAAAAGYDAIRILLQGARTMVFSGDCAMASSAAYAGYLRYMTSVHRWGRVGAYHVFGGAWLAAAGRYVWRLATAAKQSGAKKQSLEESK